MKRSIRLIALVLLSTALLIPALATAQLEPTAIIDAVFQDLTNKLGKPISRVTANWTWEQQNFPDSSLGCPQPNVAYTQVVTKGYIINVEPLDLSGKYDYRANLDGSVLFLCSAVPPIDVSKGGTPAATVVAPNAGSPTAQQPVTFASPVIAYIGADGNVLVTSIKGGNSGLPVALTGDANRRYPNITYPQEDHSYSNLQWSPDGTRLLFADAFSSSIYVVASGQAPQLLSSGQPTLMPAGFSPDSREIAYAISTGQFEPNTTNQIMQLQAVTGVGAAPRAVGTIRFGTGCGGGGYPPSVVQYFRDSGYSGNPLLLRWTAQGFLHSLNCLGIGLRLVDFNGNTLWEQTNLKRAVVSPDGTRILAISQGNMQGDPSVGGNAVVLIDLASGATTTLFTGTPESIERVGWTPDGSQALFSTKRVARTVTGNAGVQLGSQVFIDWPHTATTYTLELYRTALFENSTPTLISSFEGYGVSSIATAANSLFSTVGVTSSDVPVVEKLNAGGTLNDLAAVRAKVSIYAVAVGGSSQLTIPEGAAPVFSAALQFVAVPANGQSTAPLAPPTLVVGGQAVVNVKAGDAINIRQSPSRSANVIKTLPRGAVVTIMGAAVEAEGLRWWPVRVEPTGEMGWAVDQVTENGVTEFTLVAK